jgi:antitoxin component YwqK of YwqJK toxin-antitoxin module
MKSNSVQFLIILLFCFFKAHSQRVLDMNGCVKMYGDAEITNKGATYDAYISNECNEYMIIDRSEYKVKFRCVRESNGSEFNKTKDIDFPYVFMKPYSSLKKDKKGNDSGSYFFNEILSQTGRLGGASKADFSAPSSNAILLNSGDWTYLGQNGNVKVSARIVTQSFTSWEGFNKYKVEFLYANESSAKQETTTFFNYSVLICGLSFPGSSSVSKIKGNDIKTDIDRFDAIFNFEPTIYLIMGDGNIGTSATTAEPVKQDGEYTINYPSGSIKEKGTYLNGVNNGMKITYFENGTKKEEVPYVNGIINGKVIGYYENGVLMVTVDVKDGEIYGDFITYYEDGVIKSKYNESIGLSTNYYPSGKIQDEVNYVDGKKSGLGKFFYETGELEAQYTFVEDVAVGEYKSFYKSGKLKSKVNYVNGKKEGEYKEYYESGKLKAKCIYVNDKIVGTYKEFHENGIVKIEVDYIDGEKQGLEKEYSKEGKVIKETMH